MATKLSHGNCFFGILYILLRGKAYEIIGVSTTLWWWPIHFMAANKNGHILHFQHGTEAREFEPWFFPGTFIGISKRRQQRMLAKSGRKIKFRTKRVRVATVLLLLLWLVLVIPFATAIFGMIFVWNFKWAGRAISRRIRHVNR